MRALALTALLLARAASAAGGFDWGSLPGEFERVPIGPQLSDGKPVFVEMRRVKGRPEDVLTYCLGRFNAAGLYVARLNRQLQGPGPSLTAFDSKTRTSYSVAVMTQGDGTLDVILGNAEHARRVDEGGWPPLPSGAKSPLRSVTEGARTLTFNASLEPDALAAWYDDALTRQGFVRQDGARWERGQERVLLHTQKNREGTAATVLAEGPHALLAPAVNDGGQR
ncbi:MAG: hypothetical protein IPJ65_23750 [Archangiaceae bacterium]|nr:hypothetical protein [Archangiaceae bacterium]